MTWPAAVPAAALRAMRTAAGWRAVRLALLVGAVFVLGVLCGGERAQAADGGPVPETGLGAPVADAPPGSNSPASIVDALTVPSPDAAGPIGPLTGTVVRTVDERVAQPVAELAGAVTGRLDETTHSGLPGLAHPAPLPGLTRPTPPPGPADVPEQTPPEPAAPGPRPDTATQAPSRAPHRNTQDEPKVPDGQARTPGPLTDPFPHGPESTRGTVPVTDAHPAHRSAQDAEPAPHAPDAPAGRPDGVTGGRAAVDHGTPRPGGDARTVAACPRPPLRPVPGAVERAGATGERAPYRAVPVSPA
ncbi:MULTISPECIES: hypothetical protein [Streptomyces]|uniref:Secreted protein n=1 Tax=Streptomyces edwardsiae TaxID=3075527 RepID=A0ABU2PXJ5_9ACTN|nr:hypothetical protein [Streptomyces sp. DSM 41636]MDT0396409.1 hypothetical protein [Streptomyces sp. DSM 41636]